MSASSILHEVEHVIPEHVICKRASRLLNHLVMAGEDPAGLHPADLAPIVVKMQVTDWVHHALDHGFGLEEPRWHIGQQGEARVILPFRSEADAMVFRTTVL